MTNDLNGALSTLNLAVEAAFNAARRASIEHSFADGDDSEIATVEDNYDDKVDAMNAAVDTMIAAALSFAAATRALAEAGATRLACVRLEAAARALGDEYERRDSAGTIGAGSGKP